MAVTPAQEAVIRCAYAWREVMDADVPNVEGAWSAYEVAVDKAETALIYALHCLEQALEDLEGEEH